MEDDYIRLKIVMLQILDLWSSTLKIVKSQILEHELVVSMVKYIQDS